MSAEQSNFAFVIQVAGVAERKENARILKENCGLKAEFWPSVNVSSLPDSDVRTVIASGALFEPIYPHVLNVAEINQFLSHRQVWAEIIRRDLPYAMVFEDIAAVCPIEFYQAFRLAVSVLPELGYIQFATEPVPDVRAVVDHAGASTLYHPIDTVAVCAAQCVTQDAARRLLSASQLIDRPLPAFLQSHWITGVRPGIIDPSGVMDVSDILVSQPETQDVMTLRDRYADWVYNRSLRQYAREADIGLTENLLY